MQVTRLYGTYVVAVCGCVASREIIRGEVIKTWGSRRLIWVKILNHYWEKKVENKVSLEKQIEAQKGTLD